MDPKVIQIGDEGQRATRDLVRRLDPVLQRQPQFDALRLRSHFRSLESIDRQFGGHSALPLEDVEALVAAAMTELAHLEQDVEVANLTVGVALWAIRHEVAIAVVEPVANALAIRSNATSDKAELSALVGLMQGVIAHVAPRLSADLERSNPERPWRILHANLAITAIRTEDPALMDFAFDALDRALPDERRGFYAEALALALAPRVAREVRECIEARHRTWNP